MPRYARKHQLAGSCVYHIINRGNKKEPVFNKEEDYFYFTRLLKEYSYKFDLKIYHWALMPNHYHLLLEISNPEFISSCMAGINRAYTCYHHRMNSTAGFLWQGRFRMQIIQKERYLSVCARYIEMNPVKACMVLQAQDYLFSSARFYCFGNEDGVTTESPIFMGFGNDIDVRRTAYKDFLGKLYNSRDEYRYEFSSTPFGDREFINTMVKVGGRLLPKRRGRPRERKDCFITH